METPSLSKSSSNLSLPNIKTAQENEELLTFTITNCNVSVANALRRTLISDIDTVIIQDIDIYTNTTKLNNEILKHRLSCMPVHIKDLSTIDGIKLEINEVNNTDALLYITTRNIKIKNKETDTYLTEKICKEVFPANEITKCYPLFCRLKPKLTNEKSGQIIKLSASLKISNARENGMYNVVSTCAYKNSPDIAIQNDEWQKIADRLSEKEIDSSTIQYEKENWFTLKAKRFFVENSFDFKVESVGVFTNLELMHLACDKIINSLNDIITKCDSDKLTFEKNTTTLSNSVDIILENYGYTIGKLLEYILHHEYYLNDNQLSYIGFIKKHPHDDFSIIRLAFINSERFTDTNIYSLIKFACQNNIEIFKHIKNMF